MTRGFSFLEELKNLRAGGGNEEEKRRMHIKV